jgi:hypothetical protein
MSYRYLLAMGFLSSGVLLQAPGIISTVAGASALRQWRRFPQK